MVWLSYDDPLPTQKENMNLDITALLASPIGIAEVKSLALCLTTEQLQAYLLSNDLRTARNAAWTLTHKSAHDIGTLPQAMLVDLAMSTDNVSLRRLTLSLIERQAMKEEELRSDFLDFCLLHMTMLEEPSGVQALCMKIAYKMCAFYPELMQEFETTLHLMHTEHYKPGMRSLMKKIRKQTPTR